MILMNVEINDYTNHIEFFKKIFSLRKDIKTVLEYGSGEGSKYLIDNCDKLISVEMQSEDWFNKIKSDIKDDKHEYHLKLGGQNFKFINTINEKIDMVFVDGHGDSRPECVQLALDRGVKYIIAHDTNDMGYGWQRVDIPDNYKFVDFTKYPNWATLFTTDFKLISDLSKWAKNKYAE